MDGVMHQHSDDCAQCRAAAAIHACAVVLDREHLDMLCAALVGGKSQGRKDHHRHSADRSGTETHTTTTAVPTTTYVGSGNEQTRRT